MGSLLTIQPSKHGNESQIYIKIWQGYTQIRYTGSANYYWSLNDCQQLSSDKPLELSLWARYRSVYAYLNSHPPLSLLNHHLCRWNLLMRLLKTYHHRHKFTFNNSKSLSLCRYMAEMLNGWHIADTA